MKVNPFNKELFLNQAVEIFPDELENIKSCLIVAPHPDDESLGCGGLIALMRSKKIPVSVIMTTDGSQSHPNSKAFPPESVKRIRKKEVLNALRILGVEANMVTFLDAKDTSLPTKDQEGFEILLQKSIQILNDITRDLIVIPYELDPHCDHRATWQLITEALKSYRNVTVWEYLIWLYELAEREDIPDLKTGQLKKIDIGSFLHQKKEAIASHVSQTTTMIDDDPTGFILTEDMIAHFTSPTEYFIQRS